jgi:hypothetical protein
MELSQCAILLGAFAPVGTLVWAPIATSGSLFGDTADEAPA